MSEMTIRIKASDYQDHDEPLTVAAAEYAADHDLAGWDLNPRYEDEEREVILLDVPVKE